MVKRKRERSWLGDQNLACQGQLCLSPEQEAERSVVALPAQPPWFQGVLSFPRNLIGTGSPSKVHESFGLDNLSSFSPGEEMGLQRSNQGCSRSI